jgi:hypothetical protein
MMPGHYEDDGLLMDEADWKALQEKEEKRRKIAAGTKDWFAGAIIGLIGAWGLMLLVGVVHHQWLPGLPTIGWWDALLVYVLGDFVFNCWAWGARVKVMK